MATKLKLAPQGNPTTPITLEHLCNAVDAVPGTRIGPFGHRLLSPDTARVTAELQLGVEVYDPEVEDWRLLVALVDGVPQIDREDIEDRVSVTRNAVAQIARLLDACLVTEDGVVLVWGSEQDPDA